MIGVAERDDLRQSRERNLEELAALGLPYLPNRYPVTRTSAEIKRDYKALEGSCVRVAGRLMRVRLMGKAAFAHLQDAAGQIQIYCKLDVLGPTKYQYFKLLDVGDIIGVEGSVFETRTGEVTVQARDLVLLAKSYLPLPDKYHGLAEVETRYRQRYLDLIANEETRHVFQLRSAATRCIRRYLDERGFIEVETPTLQALYGGAAATPFVTRYEALDMQVYLRIADELYLKRLIVGGMERVYEIAKDFRNEGFSRKNSPEFTMLELYQAYVDYRDIMALAEDMISTVAQKVLGGQKVTFGGNEIDLTPPWRRITISEALQEYAGIDLVRASDEDLLQAVRQNLSAQGDEEAHGEHLAKASTGELVEELVGAVVEPHLIQPTFLYDFPVDFPGSLLAKRKKDNPEVTERFEVYIGGMELGNAFTELNEPEDQLRRMEEAVARGGAAYQQVDWDYILALEHGMPPTGGIGIGIDRLVMILADLHQIREAILFPLLRPREVVHAEP
jgi:lysyl-tRNA synthetase class 2